MNQENMYLGNLLETLKGNVELTTGMLVGSKLIREMEIYGFVPYLNKKDMSISESKTNQLLDLRYETIASDRIVIAIHRRTSIMKFETEYIIHPIARKVKQSIVKRQLLLEKLYMISMWQNKIYQEIRNKRLNVANYSRLKDLLFSQQIIVDKENQKIYYETCDNDFLMYKKITYSEENVSAVASYFLVVCRFINTVTGEISYAIYPPEDLVLLANNKTEINYSVANK